jgi:osmotically-inducible protein OsmY
MQTLTRLCVITTLGAVLSGCGAVVVGGVATGAVVAHDRRTTGTVVEDKEITLRAGDLRAADPDIRQRSNIAITTYNLKVLLTGQAESAELSQRLAAQIAQLPRVTHVYNEVTVGAESTWSDAASDTFLTGKVKVALFDIKMEGFDPLRVKVTTSKNTVYLMGLVTRAEADAVTDKVRYLSGVEKVVRLFDYIQPAS